MPRRLLLGATGQIVAPTARLQDGTVDAQPAVKMRAIEELILDPERGWVMAELDRGGNGVLGRTSLCSMSNRIKTC